jgi:hypothetical protein
MQVLFQAPTPLPARTLSVYATIHAAQVADGVTQTDPVAVRAAGVAAIPAAWELVDDFILDPDADPALHFAPDGFVGITYKTVTHTIVSEPCNGQERLDIFAMLQDEGGNWSPGFMIR